MWPWLNIALTLVLVGVGLWYLLGKVSLAEIGRALALAKVEYIALSVAIMIVTLFIKTVRWRLLLTAGERPPSFLALFWAMMLGQYVNLLVPFLRLGEIARAYALNQQSGISKARALSTLVVEKTLDMIMLGLTMGLLLTAVVIPDYISNFSLYLGVIALAALLLFYLLAYQTSFVIHILQKIVSKLPLPIGKRLMHLALSGLEGLAALRSRSISVALITTSVIVAILSVLTPLTLFPALNIQFGLVEATLIHIVVTIALVPASTPGKIIIFDGAVAFLLVQLGLENEAVIAAYTIIFHIVIVVPQILLGAIATSRTNWQWRHVVENRA